MVMTVQAAPDVARSRWRLTVGIVLTLSATAGFAHAAPANGPSHPRYVSGKARLAAIRRAHVWVPTDVAAMDVKAGPAGPGAFAPDASVTCEYVPEKSSGNSPKFTCLIPPDDKVHVKYGTDNGEVFAEVAASRLFWALGFGAERIYPVRVDCRGCPEKLTGTDFGSIQRMHPGEDIQTRDLYGWAWPELDEIDRSLPPAERAARGALKLLAVFVQHTDTKTEQQRFVCMDAQPAAKLKNCQQPLMMIHDLGQTFGHANIFNRDKVGSVNLRQWAASRIWKDPDHCVGNLAQSQTGTLSDPVISEAGRKFLADLLMKLSDGQIRDLFEVARFPQRTEGSKGSEDAATVDEWVGTFKAKRDEIVNHTCPP
jgi:hypothetical protein